jgi:hypothetical protein
MNEINKNKIVGKKFCKKCIKQRSDASYSNKDVTVPKKSLKNKTNKEMGRNILYDLEVEMEESWLDALIEGINQACKKDEPEQ